jgi:CDP-glucose 4,6-dehydratase
MTRVVERRRLDKPFGDFYRGKTVLVTGHTGFKGSWLAAWLAELGARVVGYALEPPTPQNAFTALGLAERITHVHGDVRDAEHVLETVRRHRPEVVFHLAAQSLVRRSFKEPRLTFETNLMGTVNVLDALRQVGSVRSAVLITSDKCYQNVNWAWGYRETDPLGGYDAYSASKACAELAIASYQDPRFQRAVSPAFDLPIASTRAGNVIGGGDWAADRIVPDCIRAISGKRGLVVRNPDATRPWQHVLEPLSGYLWLGSRLATDRQRRYCSAWNFGPADGPPVTVETIVRTILSAWPAPATRLIIERDRTESESQLLRLDCSKARHALGWRATWTIERTLEAVVEWYRHFYEHGGAGIYERTVGQIRQFVESARAQRIRWAADGGRRARRPR